MSGNMKYLPNGQAVEIIQKLDDGWLVNDIVDLFEGEFMTVDPIYVVKQVFDKVPTLKYDQQIQKLTDTIASLQESRKKVEALLKSEESDRSVKIEKFRKINQLKLLEDFIDGKITHYIAFGSYRGPSIIKFEDTKVDGNVDRRGLFKLLTLYGRTNGDVEWKLNEYSTDSSCKETVIPCTSYGHALTEAQNFLDSEDPENPDKYTVDFAEKHALKLPDGYLENLKSKEKSNLIKAVDESEKTHRKNKAALLAFKG